MYFKGSMNNMNENLNERRIFSKYDTLNVDNETKHRFDSNNFCSFVVVESIDLI